MAGKEHIERLQDAIKRRHGGDPKHLKSTYVWEGSRYQTYWEGLVEVFEVLEDNEPKLCYAWFETDGRIAIVLAVSPGCTAADAVKAHFAALKTDKT